MADHTGAVAQRSPPGVARAAPGADGLPPLVCALLDPAAYPHAATDLQLHQTHVSWVVLAGPYAYKLKKPVNLGFADFSTLEQRVANCEAEVRLNRRLSPDLYLGVRWVRESDGRLHLGERGRPVEPVVWMLRLPEGALLPDLLARGAVDPALVRRLARQLVAFHESAQTGPGVDEYGRLSTVRGNWEENFQQTTPFLGRTLAPGHVQRVHTFVDAFLGSRSDLFERRVRTGRIREGHGDLHAGSIAVVGRTPYLFDCLEFSARFRCADVAAEVAFLAMDLESAGRADLARHFVDAYVRASGDGEILELLDFYTCYRAYVRGKVLSLRLDQPGLAPDEADRLQTQAHQYFDLAWAHAGGRPRRLLLVVMGRPATGKSTLARALAQRLGLAHINSDVVRKTLARLPATAHGEHRFVTGLYAPAATQRTYATLRRRAARWLRRDQPVVLDATFGSPVERRALQRLARQLNARLVVLVCEADEAVIRARLAARENDPTVVSDARLALWPSLRAAFSDPAELPDAIRLDTGGPLEAAQAQALAALGCHWT